MFGLKNAPKAPYDGQRFREWYERGLSKLHRVAQALAADANQGRLTQTALTVAELLEEDAAFEQQLLRAMHVPTLRGQAVALAIPEALVEAEEQKLAKKVDAAAKIPAWMLGPVLDVFSWSRIIYDEF